MNMLFGGAISRFVSGIMFMVFVAWIFMGYTAYERSNTEFKEVKEERSTRKGSFGVEQVNPSDPYRSRQPRDTFHDPHARVRDDVVVDAPHYGGSDWGD